MHKTALRKQFLKQRQQLPPAVFKEKNRLLAHNFVHAFDLKTIQYLHIYLPILKKNEINTWSIIEFIFQHYPHITVLISKSNFKTCQMDNYVLTPHSMIAENKWGIPEPVDTTNPIAHQKIEMIILPLLCFDKHGYRVGYGQGFYDRFLHQCRKSVVKIGLSLFEPIDDIVDKHNHDMKMDFCITPDSIWTFT